MGCSSTAASCGGRGIGTALIRTAEDRARERRFRWVGMGAGDGARNPRAMALYERLGYSVGIRYVDAWSYEDDAGVRHTVEDPCTFLVKDLPR